MPEPTLTLHCRPVTRECLPDLLRFSERHGKFRYCSCMRWRMRSTVFSRSTKDERVIALARLVQEHRPSGVLAYLEDEPVGWCSIAPRESYEGLEHYRALPRIDDRPVWSVVCFYVAARTRRQGATLQLLRAAVDYAKAQGAATVEGYPVESSARSYTYMGSPSTFLAAGFRDVTPPGQARTVMRYVI